MRSSGNVVDLAAALVEQPSENPPGDETGVAAVLEDRFRSSPIGFTVTTTDVEAGRPNVVARAGDPSGDAVLLTGHTDVVPATADDWDGDPFEPRIDDGRLIGRGVADMKGAIAAQIVAAESYLADDPAGEVVLVYVAILGEPTELDVCVAQKGTIWYRIAVRGDPAHAGSPDRATNAAIGLARVIDAIDGGFRPSSSGRAASPTTRTRSASPSPSRTCGPALASTDRSSIAGSGDRVLARTSESAIGTHGESRRDTRGEPRRDTRGGSQRKHPRRTTT